MDSACLGEVVRSGSPVWRLGGLFGLCNAAPRVRELLDITKLSQWIPVFETEDAGVEALQAEPESQSAPR